MTEKEIVKLAGDNAALTDVTEPPSHLGEPEKMLYWQIFFLCRRFLNGDITTAFAKQLKNRYLTEYGQLVLSRKVYIEHARRTVEVNIALAEGIKSGCPHCKRVMGLLDGMIKPQEGKQ